MMGIDERLFFFILGMGIGAAIGYVVGILKQIRDEVHDIDERVRGAREDRPKDERGAMKQFSMRGVALFVVVTLTLYAAILSQQASNKSNDTSDRIIELQAAQKQNLDCTTQVLFDAIRALNERTTYSGSQTDANIDLVQSQLDLLLKVQQNPNLSPEDGQALFNVYVNKVQKFIELANKTREQQDMFPYPTVDDLTNCLAQTNGDTPEPKG